MTSLSHVTLLMVLALAFALSGCTSKKAELGSEKNPVKLYFVPSVDAKVIDDNSKIFKDFLEKNTPYKFQVMIPQSYVAVVEAFGTKRADISAMNTFGYVLAHERYGAEARMTVLRHGASTYQGQILVKNDDKIKSLPDLMGKKLAFVDAASTSGYLLPLKVLKDRGIVPSETMFAGKHDNVVSMIYNGQVDAGATFYSPPDAEGIQDARRLVKTQYPDVEKKVKILELTEGIPNDPIVFRKEMPEEMKNVIVEAFLKFVATPEGKDAFKKIYAVDDIKRASDADYDAVRTMLKALGKNADELMKQ
ncbi:MAG: phosphate/phosphite/phosphonate ABC transporter substrate-binding protein [Bdellovibrio sp.]|jgi:phosphonate transport system substrate-binding protein